MKKCVVVLLLAVICCSGCSSQSSGADPDAAVIAPSSSEQSSEIHSAGSFPDRNDDDLSSFAEQTKTSAEFDTATAPDYQGFTQEQWSELQRQRELYGDLSERERDTASFNGEIDCTEFNHLWWEHLIADALYNYVGVDEFESWLKEIESMDHPDLCTVYTFSEYFSISLDELVSLIETNNLTHVYDLDTVKRRYAYFTGSPQE